MSLVNEMLQDLQQREAGDVKPLAGLHVVSSVPADSANETLPRNNSLVLSAVAFTAVLAATVYWFTARTESPGTPQPLAVSQTDTAAAPLVDVSRQPGTPAEEIFAAQILQLKTTMQLRMRPENPPVSTTTVGVQGRKTTDQTPAEAAQVVAQVSPATETQTAGSQTQSSPTVSPLSASPQRDEVVSTTTETKRRNVKVILAEDQRLRRDGLAALRGNKPQLAERHFRHWLVVDAGNAEAHQLLYESLLAQSQADAARSALLAALEQVEDGAAFAQTLALDLLAANRVPQAVLVLEKHRPVEPPDPEFEAMLAAAQQRAGDHQSAEQIYQALVRLQPQNGAWWVGLAISQEAIGSLDEAKNSFVNATLAVTLDDTLASYAFERLATLESGS